MSADLLPLKQIAVEARKEFEQGSVDKKILEKFYKIYNPMDNVPLFIKRAQKLFPKLNCGLASVYIQRLISGSKIIEGKYKNNLHTFLMLKDVLIDITADQYGGPAVYVGPLQKPWSLREKVRVTTGPSD